MIQEKKIKTFLRILIYKPQDLVLKLYKKSPLLAGFFYGFPENVTFQKIRFIV